MTESASIAASIIRDVLAEIVSARERRHARAATAGRTLYGSVSLDDIDGLYVDLLIARLELARHDLAYPQTATSPVAESKS